MKNLLFLFIILAFLFNCNTTKPAASSTDKSEALESLKTNDTVKIANDEIEYEIIIIEPGFNFWLAATAQPRGFYSQNYLENRNIIYVTEWNQRVLQPHRFAPNLYELQIDYQSTTDYGYEVNYVLYNYFIYFQLKYNQRLGPFVSRI